MTRTSRPGPTPLAQALQRGLLVTVLLGIALVPGRAQAQLSSTSNSNAGSNCGAGNSADRFCGSSTQELIDNGTTFQARYAWNINADVGAGSTRDQSGNAQHNVSFNATAPGGYRLDISTQRQGDMNRRNDIAGCNGRADISDLTGSSNVALSSGSLSLSDPGSIGNGGSTTSSPFNQTSSATIFRVSNGAAQGHSLTFTWSGSVRSNSCEAAVRLGEQNGSTTSCDACGYSGSPGRTQANDGHFVTVTYTSLCGNGVVDGSVGEQCDQAGANGSSTSCCNSNCTFRGAGQTCRTSAGVCDVAETCTGSNATCPTNGFAGSGVCRASAGVCDVAESCNGSGPNCPADGFVSAATVCRGSAGVCDVAENCTGSSAACPADGFASAATVCRGSAGVCDVAENCTGSGAACPADGFASAATVCRGSAGVCDVAENCTGSGAACPANTFVSAGTECRGSAGVCDVAESCTGSGAACPADGFASAATVCRGSAGVCDVAENCTGSGAACPADGFAAAPNNLASGGTASQSSTDVGTANRAIDGNTNGNFAGGSVTRTLAETEAYWEVDLGSIGSITNIEIWNRTDAATAALSEFYVFVSDSPFTGTSIDDSLNQAGVLPFYQTAEAGTPSVIAVNDTGRYVRVQLSGGDALTLAEVVVNGGGTLCRPDAGACDADDYCDGSGVSCSPDDKLETECRDAAGVCDAAESCDGVGNDCPADAVEPVTTECRAVGGVCDVAENCDGVNIACPADDKVTAGTECRASAGVCDPAEACDGSGNDCPADAVEPITTTCRASGGVCDVAENCDGVSVACPADGKVTAGTECRASAGVCDPAEACDGSTNACPGDAREPNTTVCRASGGVCDAAENCDGSSVACPADGKVTAGTECRASDGVCDPAEACDGSGNDCPADAVEPATTVCRASAGGCDIVENCDGASDDCPADVVETAGTECRGVAGVCDVAEACDGTSAACPTDDFEPSTTECRNSAGLCDPAEFCTGSAAACPANALEPAGTVCRPALDPECDVDEQCDGSVASCPADVTSPDGQICDDEDGGTTGETCVGGLCGCLGDDLDGDTITDNCDPDDAPMTITKGTVWATGSKPGRMVLRGVVPTGILGPNDLIDISDGLTLAAVDANEMNVVAPFLDSECSLRSSGLIRCSRRLNATQKWKLTLKPIKVGGVPTGELQLKALAQGFDINVSLTGPLTASISHGFIDRVGSKACTGGPFRMDCR